MEEFIDPILGGGLIGISASILWLGSGKTAGISGIIGGMVQVKVDQILHRVLFLLGLIIGGVICTQIEPQWIYVSVERSMSILVAAGLLVGIGTRVGSGCTSGHGVCGISKFSLRSIIATMAFMCTGFLVATWMAGGIS